VDTKCNPNNEDDEEKFDTDDDYRDGCVESFKPPYVQKCLNGNGLSVKSQKVKFSRSV
jgi:hypothetical protein